MKLIDGKDVTGIVRRTLGFVDNRLVEHGERVAYLVWQMMECRGGYTDEEIRNFCFLSLIHDIGAYKTEEIDNLVQFETGDVWSHSIYGYLFIKYLSPLSDLASVILFHHCDYELFQNADGRLIQAAQMINIADRMDVYWSSGGQKETGEFLSVYKGNKFSGDIIELFCTTNKENNLKLPYSSVNYLECLLEAMNRKSFTESDLNKILSMLVSTIDFRSHHTVVHSIMTTSIGQKLGKGMGLREDEMEEVYYGALLHDLGKIGVPVEILEHPGKLCNKDMEVMRRHVDYTGQILNGDVNQTITNIALRHHEKLDGSGYPRGLSDAEMTQSEKIVAVADMISALCGKRSYKEPYSKEKTVEIIWEQVRLGRISKDIVTYAVDNYDDIIEYSANVSEPVLCIYDNINMEYKQLMEIINETYTPVHDKKMLFPPVNMDSAPNIGRLSYNCNLPYRK